MSQPLTPPVDDKDWTWVLERPCLDCGFDAAAIEVEDLPALVLDAAAVWPSLLGAPNSIERPSPAVWSVLEYACHVRDVMNKMTERNQLILQHDAPTFPNWDQDATAVEERYWEQDPSVVTEELKEAAARSAAAWSGIADEDWDRVGYRSNGSTFTLRTLGKYYLHDLVHHVHDVQS